MVIVTLLALGLMLTGAAAQAQAPGPACDTPWGSQPESGGELRATPLLATRTGQHACYDRLVFEFDGDADGYNVRYAQQVLTEGQGLDLVPYTAGGAYLSVQLLAPAYDENYGATYPHRTGDHVANVVGYQTLRDVVFGGSFEGYSTFAVGVRATLPFRVFVLDGPGTHSRIVIDVAHRWV